MRLGSMNNPRNSVLDEAKLFAEFGLDYTDLTVEAPEASPEQIKAAEPKLRKILSQNNMSVVCHMPWFLQITSPYPRIRDAFIREAVDVLEVAASFNAEHVTIHPDFLTLHRPKSDLTHLTVDALGTLLDKAGEKGLKLCFENFEKTHVSTEVMEDVFKKLPGLKFTLDVGHAFMGAHNTDHITHMISEFKSRLTHVHMHDNAGVNDDHLPLGVGKIDFPAVVSALKEAGYDDTITLEIHSRDRDYIKISKEKMAAFWGR